MKKLILSVSVACAALLTTSARVFELTLWRGETTAAILPDFCETGAVPAGIHVKAGRIKKVDYAPTPGSMQRLSAYDRVVWKGKGDGLRVVEVSVPADTKPGVYEVGMMKIKVLDRVLPPAKEWKYYLDLWQHPWAVARVAGVKPFSKEHYEAMRPEWELLASAGQKTVTVSLLDMPWDHQCFDAYHSMFEDGSFKLFDEYVEFAYSCGLGPDISCYSLCPWTLGRGIDENELEKRWGAFLDRFAAHLKKKGWYEHTLMAMDERAPEDVRKVWNFVQRHAPGMRISMAGNRNPADFKGISIDVYSQVLTADCVTPQFLEETKARHERGLVTTMYVCCGPKRPNTFIESADGEAFWCGFAPSMLGLDGFLRWAWNSWPENPKADASYGTWTAGDTFLVYPGAQPSWRFLELRNGIVAAEKARILMAAGEYAADFAALRERINVKAANDGRSNFQAIRRDTLKLVNR